MTRTAGTNRNEAAENLKRVARRLFAERGVDGVTVRQIAEASGQKNHAAVGYHFGSKDALIRELVIHGARVIDERRNAWLDRQEAQGGPRTVREVVDVLVQASVDIGEDENYNRFIVMLGMTHRQFFMETLAGQWNSGYQRCLDHLRRLMPPLPPAMKNQRLLFLGAALGAVMAARETGLADTSRSHPTWGSPHTLSHFAHAMTAMLEAPPEDPPEEPPEAARGDS
ncbi:TetR/AcrR family transcriptional regulator [Quisquiliibacterium transsilvanicum]|uniref:AcrR family transcriptional regulator n=1 Tax=Quisquiliibacterium transsilvanicum TaxID=1549638 RepID=A0A7W8HKW1_9BURK|nr:TetR/AcrR family transcriptional regulator [Quisquiliibacterium transsilvanicum]MBB5273291.1 AcrR family transcriptional regulator [Quisquiliibacterium transsilvanicum]